MIKQYYTVKETAERLGVTPEYVREILKRGEVDNSIKLKGNKIGKEWRINPSSVNTFLGIDMDSESYKKDIKIKELEGKIKTYELQLSTLKNMIYTFQNLVNIDNS